MRAVVLGVLAASLAVLTATPGWSLDPLAEVEARERQWAQALLTGDLEAFDDLLHAEFRLVRLYVDQPPISKAAYIAMEGIIVDRADYDILSSSVRDDMVSITLEFDIDWRMEGRGPLPGRTICSDIWVPVAQSWKILQRVCAIPQ